MLQFRVLTGKMAGTSWVARRFPVRIGRAPSSDFRLEENGVWDQHLQVDFVPAQGIVLETKGEALVRVNDQPVQQAVLRNGDLIQLGSAQLQFWLSQTHQQGLGVREGWTWFIVAAVAASEIALLYWLLR
jgi:pSer/pThr/pTyr-binding forkhead associated (FHA) protein